MTVKLNGLVRLSSGEITTINDLDAKGLIVYETCLMTGPKRNGERKEVRHYQAVIKSTKTDKGWQCFDIGKFAYLSKTKQEIVLEAAN